MGGVEVPDTYSYLLGDWLVERTIEDHRSDISGSFSGTVGVSGVEAVREAAEAELPQARYREIGRLRWSGQEMSCERGLLIARIGTGRVALSFPDGRHFVDVDLRQGTCDVRHDCGADTYDISFVVRSENLYEEHWQVKGPSKDYEARARYQRARTEAV